MEAQLTPTPPAALPTISRVVVGFDGSRSSRAALRLATRLGRTLGAPVEAVRTWEQPVAPFVSGGGAPAHECDAIDREVTADLERSVADELRGDAEQVRCVVERGPAARALIRHAHAHDVLVVLGTCDLARTDRGLLGPTTQDVLGGADAPVLIVPEGSPVGDVVRRIVVGVDGTPGARQAVLLAGMVALQSGAVVHAVHAAQPSGGEGLRDRIEHEAWAHEHLEERWTSDIRARGVDVAGVVTEAEPKAALVAIADDEDADLIVVGRSRRGVGPVSHLGPVAGFLARHTRRPLLIAAPSL